MKTGTRLLLVACLAAVPAACGEDLDPGGEARAGGGGAEQTLIVGSANFPENALLGEIYAGALKAKGSASRRSSTSARARRCSRRSRRARSTCSPSTPARC